MQKYIALRTEYEERINWSCGIRVGDVSKMECPDCHCYVSIWTDDGNRHTIFGGDLDTMQKQCYDEFVSGERNNVMPCSYQNKSDGRGWLGKLL